MLVGLYTVFQKSIFGPEIQVLEITLEIVNLNFLPKLRIISGEKTQILNFRA